MAVPPEARKRERVASPAGFEPTTPNLGNWCSILLSYEDVGTGLAYGSLQAQGYWLMTDDAGSLAGGSAGGVSGAGGVAPQSPQPGRGGNTILSFSGTGCPFGARMPKHAMPDLRSTSVCNS